MGLARLTATSTTYLPRDPCGTPRRNLLPKIQRDGLPCKDAAALVHAAELEPCPWSEGGGELPVLYPI